MAVVLLVGHLLSGDKDIAASGGDNVVSHVLRWVVVGLVLAHEDDGNGGGETAEGAWVIGDGDVVPGTGVG